MDHIVITHMRKSVLERKEKQHVAWASERENGQRGFGITGAHHHKSWDNDDFQNLCTKCNSCGRRSWRFQKTELSHQTQPKTKGRKRVEPACCYRPKKALFTSKLITPKTKNHSTKIEAKIKGWKISILLLPDGGNGYSCDWADWANPVLIDDKGKQTKLTSLSGNQPKRLGTGKD